MNHKRRGIITDRIVKRAAEARGLGVNVDITAAQVGVPVQPLRKAVNAYLKAIREADMPENMKAKK